MGHAIHGKVTGGKGVCTTEMMPEEMHACNALSATVQGNRMHATNAVAGAGHGSCCRCAKNFVLLLLPAITATGQRNT